LNTKNNRGDDGDDGDEEMQRTTDDGDDGDDDQLSTEEKTWKKNNSRYKIQLTVESSRV
jgi:hypothetical protein